MSYSLVVVVAIIIHLLLNSEYFKEIEDKNGVNKAFRSYVWSALWYYVMDALWGIIYESHIQSLIYLISILYYISMAATVVFLCGYVTSYLKMKTGFGKFIKCFGIAFCAFEIGLLAINHFYHIFFWVDPNGVYYAYGMRDVALCMQVLLCVLLAIQTGTAIKKSTGEVKKRYFTIFLFCIEMTVAIIVQILYPLLPLYSIGLILGICIIHTFVNESEKEKQYNALLSIADIHYSMHEIDLINDTVEEFNAKDVVKAIVNHQEGAADMMKRIMSLEVVDEHKDAALEFTDLETLAERMRNKKTLSAMYIGKRTGWFLAMFITTETDSEDKPIKVIFTTRIIEEEKKQEEKLIAKSHTDELTRLLNRTAYEEDIYNLKVIPEKFIYIALDVNGLKVVNDSIGHAAGDELIIGASECMKRVLGTYGKVYRTGGDEFVAIEFVSENEIAKILEEFDEAVSSWSGKLVDSLSISYGFVAKEEHPDYHASQFASEADKRMYQAKTMYYRKKGVDRRGQQDAHRVLCETYTKILKVNLTEDSYQIINLNENEKDEGMGFSEKISSWLHDFAVSGQVHSEDIDEYLEKTNLDYMKQYFKTNKTHIITYRRKYEDDYKRVMLEMIPANDYSEDNQSVFLYVNCIE